jgi:hypothetical protein
MQTFFYYIKIAEEFDVIRLIFVHSRCFFALRRMTTAYTAISVTAPPCYNRDNQATTAQRR